MAEASPPTKTEALSSIDARYLGEYVEFSGQLREYVNDTLGKAFRADPSNIGGRCGFLNLMDRDGESQGLSGHWHEVKGRMAQRRRRR